MANDEFTVTPAEPESDQHALVDYEQILSEYRHRQMLDNLTGPFISLILHIILIVAAIFLFVGEPVDQSQEIEVSMEELEIKELEPKVLEELEKLEQLAEDVVPTVEKPAVPQEAADIAVTDDFSDEMASADDELDFSGILDLQASETPLRVSGLYEARTSKRGRETQLRRFGGSAVTESAVLKALRWLKETQNADGSWSKSQKLAMTGLGLLTFLAHGETPLSEEFGETVQKAMQYLANKTMATKVEQASGVGARAYINGIVAYALSEAYGLTKIPFLKPAMERSLTYIVQGQQAHSGGWDYRYAKGQRWDLSVSGWQIQAMKAGFVAGANVPGLYEAIEKSKTFIKEVTFKNGKFGYSSPGSGSWGIQGAGTLCLQLIGEKNSSEAKAGVKNIMQNDEPVWDDEAEYHGHSNPAYNWYYETQAMFHGGTRSWRKWNDKFTKMVIANQQTDGHWACPGQKSNRPEYDPWYTTTLCALSLQVYYRYLPTYKMPKAVAQKSTSILDAIDEDLGLEID